MGHGAFAGPEHARLAARLASGPVAMVEPRDPAARRAWREIMEILFTPADAVLAACLPVRPTTPEKLMGRTGLDAETLRARLDDMAHRGLVLDLVDRRTGEQTYMLAPPVVGFFAELAGGTAVGRALVHEELLPEGSGSEVLAWERATALVELAGAIALTNCMCRHAAMHLGTSCDFPMESCMSLGFGAETLIRHGRARPIARGEALDLLHAGRERGLVHIGDNVQESVTYLCSCCACCCHELRSVQVGLPMVQPSGFEPVPDAAACTGCGRCVKACPVQALSLVARPPAAGGEATRSQLLCQLDTDRCIGCAVCVGACSEDALTMVRRAAQPHVPVNAVEQLTRRMIERGRLADLLVDGAAGRGPKFAQAVLAALLRLPPAERLLAREQVRSRFVDYALARYRV